MRTVAFVAFATLRDKGVHELDEATEIWTLNHGHKFTSRIDLLIDIHPRALLEHENYYQPETRELHLDYLRQPNGPPVYMQNRHPDFPGSVPYPLGDALKLAGRRLRSTFDYMAALAILEGVDRVEVYGFEMDFDTEYRYQKPSALYWIGRMEGAGIEVDTSGSPELFPDAKLYGYESTQMVSRQTLDAHLKGYEKQLTENERKLEQWKNKYAKPNGNPRAIAQAADKVIKYQILVEGTKMVIESIQHLIGTCDLPEDIYKRVEV